MNDIPQLKNKIAVVTGGQQRHRPRNRQEVREEGACVFIAGRRHAEIGSNLHWRKDRNLQARRPRPSLRDRREKIDVIFAGAAFVKRR